MGTSARLVIASAAAAAFGALVPTTAIAVPAFVANAGAFTGGSCITDSPGSPQNQPGPTPITAHIVCGAPGGAEATAISNPGAVGASSSAISSGGVFGRTTTANADGVYQDTSVVFTGQGSFAEIQIRTALNGFINASNGADARLTVSVQTAVPGGFSSFSMEANGGAPSCSALFITSFPDCSFTFNGGVLVTNPIVVPLNREVLVQLNISTTATAQPGPPGGSNSAHVEFADTFSFDAMPFVLPEGVTANAPDSLIVDNRYLPLVAAVPEPSSALLVGAGLLVTALRARSRGVRRKP